MTALWFAAATLLVTAGLLLLALARRKPPAGTSSADQADPDLFTPAVEPTPNPPTHWHSAEPT